MLYIKDPYVIRLFSRHHLIVVIIINRIVRITEHIFGKCNKNHRFN